MVQASANVKWMSLASARHARGAIDSRRGAAAAAGRCSAAAAIDSGARAPAAGRGRHDIMSYYALAVWCNST